MDESVNNDPRSSEDNDQKGKNSIQPIQETELDPYSQQQSSGVIPTPISAGTPKSFCLASIKSSSNVKQNIISDSLSQVSVLMMCRSPNQTKQPISIQVAAPLNLLSPKSNTSPNAPAPLFLQALSKINTNSLGYAVIERLKLILDTEENNLVMKNDYSSPPESLGSAPPSYSFVLRQINRRRPRLMGTFIPSPSFIQHTPPPNYAGAFDIYVDNPHPAPIRTYNFGFNPIPVMCQHCGYFGITDIICKVTICTHISAVILCLFCCWFCVPLPYLLRSCKDVYHYCRNCRCFLGMYCPTNPDSTYPPGFRFNQNAPR